MESCQTSCWNTICDSCTGKRRWQGRTSRTLRFRKPWFPWRLQREDKLGLEKSSRRVRISTMILNYFRGDLRSPAMCIHVFTSSLACHNMRDLHQMWVNYFPSEIFMHLKCSSNVVKAFRANELELEKQFRMTWKNSLQALLLSFLYEIFMRIVTRECLLSNYS